MLRRITDILVLVLIAVIVSGCRLKRPDDVLSPKKMENILYDYHLAQSVSSELPRDERFKTDAYINWVYRKNNVTKEEFEHSLKWYCRYPKEFAKIYKHISNRVEDEYKSASKALSQIEKKSFDIESGDSIDLWYLNRTALLNTSVLMDKLSFNVSRDTTFHDGDTIVWTMNSTFVQTDTLSSARKAYIYMAIYAPDSIWVADTLLTASGPVNLQLQLRDAGKMTAIRGFINYYDDTDDREGIFVLSDMSLMRYHVKQTAAVDSMAVKKSDKAPAEL